MPFSNIRGLATPSYHNFVLLRLGLFYRSISPLSNGMLFSPYYNSLLLVLAQEASKTQKTIGFSIKYDLFRK